MYSFTLTYALLLSPFPPPPQHTQANDKANVQNDIPAARDSYCCSKIFWFCLLFWFVIFVALTFTLGLLGGVGVF